MRFLIAARYYPPVLSGGSRRPFLLAKGLRSLGYEVDIAAPVLPPGEPGLAVQHVDPFMANGEPSPSPDVRPNWRERVRKLVYWPDNEIRWARRGIRSLGERNADFDVCITTSPPESVHAIGFDQKRRHGTFWVADLRDTWLDDPLDPSRRKGWRRFGERWMARRWLSQADLITAPTQAILSEAQKHAGQTPHHLLPQCSEPIPDPPASSTNVKETLIILHPGSFSLSDPERRIGPVLNMLETARNAVPHLKAVFMGRLTETEKAEAMARLPNMIELVPPQPRDIALEAMRAADILLLATAPNTRAVPGKLSEFRTAQKPIVIVGGGDWLDEAGLEPTDPLDTIQAVAAGTARPPLPPAPAPEDAAKDLVARIMAIQTGRRT